MMSSTPVLDLLSDESRWCQGTYAMTNGGRSCKPAAKQACQWCLMGAVEKCYPNNFVDRAHAKAMIIRQLNLSAFWEATEWNDSESTTHAMVVAVLREAGV